MKCSVENCNNEKIMAKGLCPSHYKRNRLYGDPLKGNTYKGEVKKEMQSALISKTDDCIFSSYSKNKAGYPRIRINGKTKLLHNYITELSKGPSPLDKPEASHSCGNGHLGCINPRHLNWKSKKENVEDSIYHGTKHSGSAKFSFDTILKMRKLLSEGIHFTKISEEFKVSPSYLEKIRLNKVRIDK